MLHPPVTKAERAARETEAHVHELIDSVLIVFSSEIHSEHMTALAARLARREKAELLAAYIIEVPLTLPMDADMTEERRRRLTFCDRRSARTCQQCRHSNRDRPRA